MRHCRNRLVRFGHPRSVGDLCELFTSAALATEKGRGCRPPTQVGAFRKAILVRARELVAELVERDQTAHLRAIASAFPGAGELRGIPVPTSVLARLVETVLRRIDSLPEPGDRIVLRALATGTHTPLEIARILDLPRPVTVVTRALARLETSMDPKLEGLSGCVKALATGPLAPPSNLLGSRDDPTQVRAAALYLLAGEGREPIAARLGRSEDQIARMLERSGLESGLWLRSGDVLVDAVRFAGQLENADLALYVELVATGAPSPRPVNWKLHNRRAKLIAWWIRALFERLALSTFGSGLSGVWLRARLEATGRSIEDLRGWLARSGCDLQALLHTTAEGRGCRPIPELAQLLSPKSSPPGPDLSRPRSLIRLPSSALGPDEAAVADSVLERLARAG